MTGSLTIIRNARQQSVEESAQRFLDRCKAEGVVAFTVVAELPDGTYFMEGSKVASRTQMAGMLLDAAMSRLQQE